MQFKMEYNRPREEGIVVVYWKAGLKNKIKIKKEDEQVVIFEIEEGRREVIKVGR